MIIMNQDKMHLVNKLFNNDTIRTVWDNEQEKYFISIVDLVGVLSESDRPRKYWSDLKNKLKQEGNEVSDKIGQLKLKSPDGKYRLTDVCDIEEMFRIIESIPSKNAEPIKQWLAKLGSERIDETFDPSITVQRAIDTYRSKGYPEEWIIKRIKGIQDRKKLESLRDNMTDIEVALADLGEIATRELAKKKNPKGLEENKIIARKGGNVSKVARNKLESELNETVVSKDNYLNYSYNDNKKIENK